MLAAETNYEPGIRLGIRSVYCDVIIYEYMYERGKTEIYQSICTFTIVDCILLAALSDHGREKEVFLTNV